MGSLEKEAQVIAKHITDDLGGYGLFGVEFFIRGDEVIFSELSPRPHDTGLLTFSLDLSEFDLHARAILHLPIVSVKILRNGAAYTINASQVRDNYSVHGVTIEKIIGVEAMLFGKPDVILIED